MPLHMIKLCVGAETVDDLKTWVAERRDAAIREGAAFEQRHQTRMYPKRCDEIVAGGSLYWVIKGQVQVRQRILEFRPVTDAEGVRRCHIILDSVFVQTEWQPRRAFQGWRYLLGHEAPADLEGGAAGGLPVELKRELADLGLL